MMRINNKFCREKKFVCFSQLLLPSPNNILDQLLTGISADAPKANNYGEQYYTWVKILTIYQCSSLL